MKDPLQMLFATFKTKVEEAIHRWLPPAMEHHHRLHEAMRYSLFAGGKRLRPLLLLALVKDLGGKADPMPAAVALECLHTYTLIHDDLPCCDNSDLRRGMPTCHIAFEDITALLAGDALQTEAFRILSKAYAHEPELGLRLIQSLASASGSQMLIGGQAEDCVPTQQLDERRRLFILYLKKTAALFRACFEMAGHFVFEPNSLAIKRLKRIGTYIGLGFQIQDDWLDLVGSEKMLGKSVGKDIQNKKTTFPMLYGKDQSTRLVQTLYEKSFSEWKKITRAKHTLLETLLHFMRQRTC